MSTQSGGNGGTPVRSSSPTVGGQTAWSHVMDKQDEALGKVNGSEGAAASKKSWASVLGENIPKRDDKNVLEVVLEKDARGSFIVSDGECVNLMRKLGLDQRPGVHVEGVQICPQGRGVIYITLKKELEINRFCRHDVFQVTESGTRVVLVKAAGKREVVVTTRGIHPNTRDDLVVDYLGRFGKVTTNKVVHGVYSAGPLQGFRNGDRSYKMEVKPGTNLGSYHAIDGQKVTLRYPGQHQTCARCHKTSHHCRGRGIAKKCESEGGLKVEFTTYILDLWSKIGYSPGRLELPEVEPDASVTEQEGGSFTPLKAAPIDGEKFTGVSIKQFSKETDHGEIMELLVKSGLPEIKIEKVKINNNGAVLVTDLDSTECLLLIGNLHGKRFFDRKIYCNGFIPLTPEKLEPASSSTDQACSDHSQGQLSSSPDNSDSREPLPQDTNLDTGSSANKPPPLPSLLVSAESSVAQDCLDVNFQDHYSSFSQPSFFRTEDFPSRDQVIRRHSLSLHDRSPPPHSLASELLVRSPSRATNQTIMDRIQNLRDSLSDFNSCLEYSGDSSDEAESNLKKVENQQFMSVNDKKRLKKHKRKIAAVTPTKDDFLIKKVSRTASPV